MKAASPRRRAFARVALVLLVLVSHLGYGFSVFADGHGAAACDEPSLAASGDAHGEGGCDHCCHAAAHFVGIIPEHAFTKPVAVDAGTRARDVRHWLSITRPPPTRPPRPPA